MFSVYKVLNISHIPSLRAIVGKNFLKEYVPIVNPGNTKVDQAQKAPCLYQMFKPEQIVNDLEQCEHDHRINTDYLNTRGADNYIRLRESIKFSKIAEGD